MQITAIILSTGARLFFVGKQTLVNLKGDTGALHHFPTMNNPKDLHDHFLENIIFGDASIENFGKHFHEDASGIGTAEHERIHGREAMISFFTNQRKELAGLSVVITRTIHFEKYLEQCLQLI